MDDKLEEKVAWLDKRIDEIKSRRKEKWSRIQRDYPDHAEFLTEVARAFGKPEKVAMMDEKTGERIL